MRCWGDGQSVPGPGPAARRVAALALTADTTWAQAYIRYAAAPTPERPTGAVVATADAERWKGEAVRVIDLTP